MLFWQLRPWVHDSSTLLPQWQRWVWQRGEPSRRPHAMLNYWYNRFNDFPVIISKMVSEGVALILCYVMLCCLILCAKPDALNEQNLMLCYAVLWFVMLTYFMSKILCSQWVKSCDLLCSHFWEIMIEIFVSKTLCTVMNEQNLIRPYEIDHFIL
jgi:hypothetical protein